MTKIFKNALIKFLYFFYCIRFSYKIFFPSKVEKTIVVLGMHRSGTSLMAGILDIMGVNMGRKKMKPTKDNKKGYFENIVIYELNKYILRKAGGSWENPPPTKNIIKNRKNFSKKIEKILKIERTNIWGWKNPITVLIIDLYIKHLINPHFIVCRRGIDDVALSLKKRNKMDVEYGKQIANLYNKKINQFINNTTHPVLEINFKEFFDNTNNTIDKIGEFLNIKINYGKKEKILNFIDPNMATSTKVNNNKMPAL